MMLDIFSACEGQTVVFVSLQCKLCQMFFETNYARWIMRSHESDLHVVKHARVLYKGFELEDAMLSLKSKLEMKY